MKQCHEITNVEVNSHGEEKVCTITDSRLMLTRIDKKEMKKNWSISVKDRKFSKIRKRNLFDLSPSGYFCAHYWFPYETA